MKQKQKRHLMLACIIMMAIVAKAQFGFGYSINISSEAYQDYLTKANEGDAESQYLMGEIYKHGYCDVSVNVQRAIDWYKQSAAQNFKPAISELIELYAQGEMIPQNYEVALNWAKKGATIDEGFNSVVANLYIKKKDYKEAIKWLEKVDTEWFSYCLMGHLYMEGGNGIDQDYRKAEEYLNKSIVLAPEWAGGYTSMAILYAKAYKQFEKAYQYLEKAKKADPDDIVNYQITKGIISYYQNNRDEARRLLNQARKNAKIKAESGMHYDETTFEQLESLLAADIIDIDIVSNPKQEGNTFAVIIGNEKYQQVSEVPHAINDAKIFAEYCKKTLGLPSQNVRCYENVTYGSMLSAINDIKMIAEAFDGDINVIFYYAGHGVPNEQSKDAFLLPVDTDGRETEACYPVSRLYKELGSLGANNVVVFLDACFSGSLRGEGMLAAARGIALKAKVGTPQGNMVVFSAAQGDETAFPYDEKNHGLFTYFLLKKLRESKGDCTLGELGDYIQRNVRQKSILVNRKSQTPTVTPSQCIDSDWKNFKLIQ